MFSAASESRRKHGLFFLLFSRLIPQAKDSTCAVGIDDVPQMVLFRPDTTRERGRENFFVRVVARLERRATTEAFFSHVFRTYCSGEMFLPVKLTAL